jgi:hypothetical protein
MLHADDSQLLDLREMERRREIIFLPCGGGDFRSWTWRLSGLGVTGRVETGQRWAR